MNYPPHGWHWWKGAGDRYHADGYKLTFAEWQVVRTWTVAARVFVHAANWKTPQPADEIGGEWGPQALPPSAAPTNALPWEVEVEQRREDKTLALITCAAFRLESEAQEYAKQWAGMAGVNVKQRTPEPAPDIKAARTTLAEARAKIRQTSRADAQKLADAEAVLLRYSNLRLDASKPER